MIIFKKQIFYEDLNFYYEYSFNFFYKSQIATHFFKIHYKRKSQLPSEAGFSILSLERIELSNVGVVIF